MSGKGTCCKEVTTTCKCIVKEKPLNKEKKKNECVATIVGVLSLPENFCKQEDSCNTNDACESKKDDCCEKKDDCNEVYRDLGECLQRCLVKANKNDSCC